MIHGKRQVQQRTHFNWTQGNDKITFSNMSPSVFNCWITINVWQQPQAESTFVIWRVCESIYKHASGGGLERLPNSVVQFIVRNRAPVLWFLVANWSKVCKKKNERAHHHCHAWLPVSRFHLETYINAVNQKGGCETRMLFVIFTNLSLDRSYCS